MAEFSNISWTDATFNPWRGCTKVSEGCANCYAEVMSHRNPSVLGEWGPTGTRVGASDDYWKKPHTWNRKARQDGQRKRVFCASLADVFEGPETMSAAEYQIFQRSGVRQRLFDLIDATPYLDWLLLTKRPQNIRTFWPDALPRRNIWLGATVENQRRFEERYPHLLACRHLASVLFLSVEPMLEMVDIRAAANGVDWVIVGGESGSQARQFNADWARVLRDMCVDSGIAFFMKQLGSAPQEVYDHGNQARGLIPLTIRQRKGDDPNEWPADLRVQQFPNQRKV